MPHPTPLIARRAWRHAIRRRAAFALIALMLAIAVGGVHGPPPPRTDTASAAVVRPKGEPYRPAVVTVTPRGRIDGVPQAPLWHRGVLWCGLDRALAAFRVDVAGRATRILARRPITFDRPITALTADGDHLYVRVGNQFMALVDVRRPDEPSRLGQTFLNSPIADIVPAGPLAYVLTESQWIHVLDVADPASITEVEALEFSPIQRLVRGDGVLLGVDTTYGGPAVQVLDITDPRRPTRIGYGEWRGEGNMQSWWPAKGAVLVDGMLHVFYNRGRYITEDPNDPYAGFRLDHAVVDVRDPRQPSLVAQGDPDLAARNVTELTTPAIDPARPGRTALGVMAPGGTSVAVLEADLRDPRATQYSSFAVPEQTSGVAISTEATLALTWHGQLHAIRAPFEPAAGRTVLTATVMNAVDVDVRGDVAVVAQAGIGLATADVADPDAPRVVGLQKTPGALGGGPFAVQLIESVAFVADGPAGLAAIDVTEPFSPTLVAQLSADTVGNARVLTLDGTTAYVGGPDGLAIVDVADPRAPRRLARVADVGQDGVNDIAVAGTDRAFALDAHGVVWALDVADPAAPRVDGRLVDEDGFAALAGERGERGHLFAATRTGLMVIDPGTLAVVAERFIAPYYAGEPPTAMAVFGGLVVAGFSSNNSVVTIDARTPDRPFVGPWIEAIGRPRAFARVGDRLWTATEAFGVAVHDVTIGPPVGIGALLPIVQVGHVSSGAQSLGIGHHPAVSPDGAWIVWTDGPQLVRAATNADTAESLPLDGIAPNLIETPVFSPDSRQLYFAALVGGHWDIYRVATGGGAVENITASRFDAAFDEQRPSVSPDGRTLAFDQRRAQPLIESDILTLDLAGGTVRRLTDDPAIDRFPAFSPDGRQMAFRSTRDGNSELYLMDADGAHPRRLTNDPAFDAYPDFGPGGRSLVFQSSRGGWWGVYSLDLASGRVEAITPGNQEYAHPRFAPNGRAVVLYRQDSWCVPWTSYCNYFPTVVWWSLPLRLQSEAPRAAAAMER